MILRISRTRFEGFTSFKSPPCLWALREQLIKVASPELSMIMDLRHIYDNAVPALIKQPLHFLLQAAGPVAQDNSPPQLEEGESIQGFFFNAEAHWFASRFAE